MRRTILMTVGLFALWVGAVAAGLRILYQYENRPGPAAAVTRNWPPGTDLQPHPSKPTLLVFAHPWCPCSQASVGELEAIMAQVQGRLAAYVLFAQPEDSSESWEKTGLWRRAAAIPGVTVLADAGGRHAQHFRATVSGYALLYDSRGGLLFSGGITAARGHSGDNAGRASILALIERGASSRTQTPVFGCDLQDPNAATLQADPAWQKGSHR